MTVRKYLSDRKWFYLLEVIFFVVLTFVLDAFEFNTFFTGYMVVLGVVFVVVFEVYDYIRRKKFYEEVRNLLDNLDEKYMLSDLLVEPEFNEGKMLCDVLTDTNKSMRDEIAMYQKQVIDYREYIELWIHEVKTPVAAMGLMMENATQGGTPDVEEELKQIEYYLDQVLYYARSASAQKDYVVKEQDLKTIVEKVIKSSAKDLIRNKVKVQLEDLAYRVFTDEKWVSFMMKQVIINSMKYKGETDPAIVFQAKETKDEVVLSIRDNGIGISSVDLPRVLERGYTGTTGRQYEKSTGMGLYLCKELADKLNIRFYVKSIENRGTEVVMGFPRNSMTFL